MLNTMLGIGRTPFFSKTKTEEKTYTNVPFYYSEKTVIDDIYVVYYTESDSPNKKQIDCYTDFNSAKKLVKALNKSVNSQTREYDFQPLEVVSPFQIEDRIAKLKYI